ncbi:MAG: radical SAM protein [Syntrophales bacterium]|nr:radical SAM protein [Syntrophales bacterium]
MQRIIPVFIMNRGCPHRCIFCNEAVTAGNHPSPFSDDAVARTIREYLDRFHTQKAAKGDVEKVQVAFYGGNFTGLPIDDQKALLLLVEPFIKKGLVGDIRISTRPDDIYEEHLGVLKRHHVKTVEIGAQSLADEVLLASGRGHSAAHVNEAVALLRAWGFEVGIHLMVGLPGDNHDRFCQTVEDVIALAPDMVRIHPTLVFRDTALSEMFYRGDYRPLSMEEALESCKYAKKRFAEVGIPLIRLGLQVTPEMEEPGAVVAGPFHPAFGSLVEASIYLDRAVAMLEEKKVRNGWVTFHVPPRKESVFRGERNGNLRILAERFHLAGIRVERNEYFSLSV